MTWPLPPKKPVSCVGPEFLAYKRALDRWYFTWVVLLLAIMVGAQICGAIW